MELLACGHCGGVRLWRAGHHNIECAGCGQAGPSEDFHGRAWNAIQEMLWTRSHGADYEIPPAELESWPASCQRGSVLRAELARAKTLLVEIGHEILGCDGVPCRVESLAFGIEDICSVLNERAAELARVTKERDALARALRAISSWVVQPHHPDLLSVADIRGYARAALAGREGGE